MSQRQNRTRDAVSERQLANLLGGVPGMQVETAPPDGALGATLPSFPPDARAVIHRPSRSAMTAGRANACRWVLEFEPRSPQFIEPLMGWTGGTDPLRHLRLHFPTREAAIAYARREGLSFTVHEPDEPRPALCAAAGRPGAPETVLPHADPVLCLGWDRPWLVVPDLDTALLDRMPTPPVRKSEAMEIA
jgi:hypothetical protein